MTNRIKDLEKEIELTKELIALRAKLEAPVVINNAPQGQGIGIDYLKNYNVGGFVNTTTPVTYGGYPTPYYSPLLQKMNIGNTEKAGWPDSEEAWKGIEKPSYKENTTSCKCGK